MFEAQLDVSSAPPYIKYHHLSWAILCKQLEGMLQMILGTLKVLKRL